jgi:hypothetical protein
MKLPSLLIIADRGHFLAYSVKETPRGPSARLMVSNDLVDGQERLSEKLTDKAGAFPIAGTGGQANAAAERMTLTAELECRTFRDIAKRIETIVNEKQPESWGFAAPSEINGAILDGIDTRVHERLTQNLHRDLTRLPPQEMLHRFSNVANGSA